MRYQSMVIIYEYGKFPANTDYSNYFSEIFISFLMVGRTYFVIHVCALSSEKFRV